MKYTYACKKVSLNDSIKAYTEKKIAKLEKYFREDTTAFVTFSVEKDHRCTVEITVRSGGALLRAQTEAPDGDMRGAVDAAVGYIERQILKNKTRLSKRLRSEGFPAPAPVSDFDVTEEKEFAVVRTKRFAVKPMSTEEAILQMNLLGHNFFVFRNSEDEGVLQALRGEAHERRGGHFADEPAGPQLLCLPQQRGRQLVHCLPPEKRRLWPHRHRRGGMNRRARIPPPLY